MNAFENAVCISSRPWCVNTLKLFLWFQLQSQLDHMNHLLVLLESMIYLPSTFIFYVMKYEVCIHSLSFGLPHLLHSQRQDHDAEFLYSQHLHSCLERVVFECYLNHKYHSFLSKELVTKYKVHCIYSRCQHNVEFQVVESAWCLFRWVGYHHNLLHVVRRHDVDSRLDIGVYGFWKMKDSASIKNLQKDYLTKSNFHW